MENGKNQAQFTQSTYPIIERLMRILDQNNDKALNNITIYLQLEEAIELRDSLNYAVSRPLNYHSHVPSVDYSKEITICIYDSSNIENFDERSKKIIVDDI